jgi:hypothetical protein
VSGIGCPTCGDELDRVQPAAPTNDHDWQPTGRHPGIYAGYPCGHWLTPSDAADVVATYRASRDVDHAQR